MRRMFFILLTGVFLTGLSACGGPTKDESGDASKTESASETMETATAAPPACVAPVPEGAVCTKDINVCGHASTCGCDAGYSYNAAIGQCVLDIQSVSEATKTDIPNDSCVTDPPPDAICTRDINACGLPSHCTCQDGFAWNDVAGKCVKTL